MNIYTWRKDRHIGKRWAAGVWCWDCKVQAQRDVLGLFYFCTHCGQRCSDETLSYNPAFRELGFDKSEPRKHTGVDGASGFVWQIGEYGLGETIDEIKEALKRRKFLVTEYGEKLTIDEFNQMFLDVITEDTSDNEFS